MFFSYSKSIFPHPDPCVSCTQLTNSIFLLSLHNFSPFSSNCGEGRSAVPESPDALSLSRPPVVLVHQFPTTNKWQMALCTAPVWKLSFHFYFWWKILIFPFAILDDGICLGPSHWLMESFDRRNYRWPSVRARRGQREETIQDKFWSNSTALIPS